MTYTEIIKVNNIEDIVIPDSPGNYKLIFTVKDTANYFGLEKSIEFKINAAANYDYLTFTSTGDSTIMLKKLGTPLDITLEYAIGDGEFTPYTIGSTVYLSDGLKMKMRAGESGNENFSIDYLQGYSFVMTGSIAASGNVLTLLDRTGLRTYINNACFRELFVDCTALTQAPELPATTLADDCYTGMFRGCTNLVIGPSILPAKTLYLSSYHNMFYNCQKLTRAPLILATTLADNRCFYSMFERCSSLTQAPELHFTNTTLECCSFMFANCHSLTQAPSILPATTLASYCYLLMFNNCTSLTQAPELPATTLAYGCYSYMFSGCTSLTQAPELPATTLANNCYYGMFYDCTSLTQAPELPAMTLTSNCYEGMFQKCTSLTQAPELPATTLAYGCYCDMFSGCTSLTQPPALPATTLADYCYEGMFQKCTSLTQAPELPATTLADGCYRYMFENCNSLQNITINADEYNEYAYNALFEMFNGATSLNEIHFTSLTFDEAKALLNNSDVAQGMFNSVDSLYVAVYFEDGYYSSLADLIGTELKCLKFTNTTDDGNWTEATLILENSGSTESEPALVCSRDGGNSWERFYINNYYYLQPNETLMIRAENYTTNSSFSNSDGYFKFSNNYNNARPLKVEGNLRWLISMEESSQYIESEFMFNSLFENFKFTNDSNITIPKPYNPYDNNNIMSQCYYRLFAESNIMNITLEPDFTSWNNYDESGVYFTGYWVYNVPSYDENGNVGNFYCSYELPDLRGEDYIPPEWNYNTY